MGTDVYLIWDGMTEEEKDAQSARFSIAAGRVGYLWASMFMLRENQILCELFPSEYWISSEPLPYDFEANYEKVLSLGAKYILTILYELSWPSENNKSMKAVKTRERPLNDSSMSFINTRVAKKLDFRRAISWLNSLFDFFDLGLRKQREGLNPKVEIL